MNWTTIWALLKKLDKKIDDLETVTFKKVTELPETGEPNVIYFVPKETAEEGNYSDEYIWDSDSEEFEKIGDSAVNIDAPIVLFKDGSLVYNDVVQAIKSTKIVFIYSIDANNRITSLYMYIKYKYEYVFIGFNFIVYSGPTIEQHEIAYKYLKNGSAYLQNLLSYELKSFLRLDQLTKLYNPNMSYNIGDIVFTGQDRSDSTLYRCKIDGTTGTWNASKWDEIDLKDLLDEKASLYDIPTDYAKDTAVTALYDSTATYELGDICMYQKELYECTTAIPVAEEWDSTKWDAVTVIDIIDSKISNAVTSVLNTSF